MPKEYPVCEELRKNASKHCVSLFVIEQSVKAHPTTEHANGTMTIVAFEGRILGVTCQHVVNIVLDRNREAAAPKFDLATVINSFYFVSHERFVQPDGDAIGSKPPDIAIRELHPAFPAAIGKIPFALDGRRAPPGIEHAVAVGYPTGIKEKDGMRVAIPCVMAIAELRGVSESMVQSFSILKAPPEIKSFSGMSGGPMFWSDDQTYGLLGITYEGVDPESPGLIPDPRIHLLAEAVSAERFTQWVKQVPRLY